MKVNSRKLQYVVLGAGLKFREEIVRQTSSDVWWLHFEDTMLGLHVARFIVRSHIMDNAGVRVGAMDFPFRMVKPSENFFRTRPSERFFRF